MLFNSYEFLLFFPIVTLVFFIIPNASVRRIWLLISSYYFYMCWNMKYIVLIVFITAVTYLSGIVLEKADEAKNETGKKFSVAISFIACLSVLVCFKYLDFLVQSLNMILKKAGISAISTPFSLILPVGISFYTFQALSYTVDVYRGNVKAEKNFVNYALFVSFFPQLVAGPIERSGNLISQIKEVPFRRNLWDSERVRRGLYLMLYGMFLKIVVADRLSKVTDSVFDSYMRYGRTGLVIGMVAFSLQIYCDFSAYSTIAIGAAKVMGFSLMENFDTPYFSQSIKEFWRRWHISLSTWFRDYLYIPLGGNRKGKFRKYINLLITFLVSGLWHGANWTFVVWGGIHGLYQIIGEILMPIRMQILSFFDIDTEKFSYKFARGIGTFLLAGFAWIFFRADSINTAFRYLFRMFTVNDSYAVFNPNVYDFGISGMQMNILIISLVVLFIVSYVKYTKKMGIDEAIDSQNIPFRLITVAMLLMVIYIYGMYGPDVSSADFIYFQF